MIPGEKALVERLKDKPFALIGINSDGNAEALKKILAARQISWRQAVDISTSGVWATKWSIRGWPTLYVLDTTGVVRYIGHSEEEMTKAVDECIAKVGTKDSGKSGN